MKTIELTFPTTSAHLAYQSDERRVYNLTVNADSLPAGMPYGPNAREAKSSARSVREMLNTLKTEPENFYLYNNGMMLVASNLQQSKDSVRIRMVVSDSPEDESFLGHGVLNGGHTYRALCMAKEKAFPHLDLAQVHISVAVGLCEGEIPGISRARNTSEKVDLFALRHLAGDWDCISDHLDPEVRVKVAFRGNESGAQKWDVSDLVRRLACLNNDLYPWKDDCHPVKSYSGVGSLVKDFKPAQFEKYAHLINDVLWLEEQIMAAHVAINGIGRNKFVVTKASGCAPKSSTTLSGKEFPIAVGDPFVLPVLAAMRVLLDEDGNWIKPLHQLWDEWGTKLVERLWATYRMEGKSSASAFGRSKVVWTALTYTVAVSVVD